MPQKNPMASSENDDISSVDVYELAACIGNQFEKLIDAYGAESVTGVMPTVIRVLEHLEEMTNRRESENTEIADLKFTVERLQTEKRFKAEERDKYEKELESIEELWKNDAKQQRDLISRLQYENHKLNAIIREKNGQDSYESNQEKELEEEVERLKSATQKQRDEMRSIERELNERNMEVESMQLQLERLSKQNGEIRRKTSVVQRMAQNAIEEKAELQALLHEKERQFNAVRDRRTTTRQDSNEDGRSSPQYTETERDKLERQLSAEGKMVVDVNDADHPRFSLTELRDVLHERNELKSKVLTLEEELQQYKPDSVSVEPGPALEEEEPAVQGPINREPDEKLYPERYRSKESGIRKFFKSFFSPSGGGGEGGGLKGGGGGSGGGVSAGRKSDGPDVARRPRNGSCPTLQSIPNRPAPVAANVKSRKRTD